MNHSVTQSPPVISLEIKLCRVNRVCLFYFAEYIIGVIQKLNLSQKEINHLQQTERECRYILENTRLNLTRVEEEFRVALNEMVIVSITEQNNLWQQCVKMKGGKSCDITPGCKTRNGACFQ